jgi:hypothetical protein
MEEAENQIERSRLRFGHVKRMDEEKYEKDYWK